jgi:hypothetical protein
MGPLIFAETFAYAAKYMNRFLEGIWVPVKDDEGRKTKVHMEVHVKPATKLHPTKPKIAREVLKEIAIEVQHFELRELSAFLTPEMVAAGWRALGFEAVNAR